MLEAIRTRLDELQRAKRIPLIVHKKEIPEVVGLSFREVRPALVALVSSGQIRFGRTISSQYFTLTDL